MSGENTNTNTTGNTNTGGTGTGGTTGGATGGTTSGTETNAGANTGAGSTQGGQSQGQPWVPPAGVDKSVAERVSADAKEFGWSPEQANKFALAISKRMGDNRTKLEADQAKARADRDAAWKADLDKDANLGGNKYEETAKSVDSAIEKMEAHAPGLKALLTDGQVSRHPAVMRLFSYLSKQMGEDKFVGGGNKSGEQQSLASLLYGDTK